MAEGSLGQHWRERTPDERADFVQVFAAVFAYLGDTIEGDITTKNNTAESARPRLGVPPSQLDRRESSWKSSTRPLALSVSAKTS